MIRPKIRFNERTIDNEIVRGGHYNPLKNIITVNPTCDWKDKIGILVHELVHWYQWYFVYRKNTRKWNREAEILEGQADRIQDFIYYTLLRGE